MTLVGLIHLGLVHQTGFEILVERSDYLDFLWMDYHTNQSLRIQLQSHCNSQANQHN